MRIDNVRRLRPILYTAMLLLVTAVLASTQVAQSATLPLPTIEGPITGPGDMWPGLTGTTHPGEDPADYGYVTDEYFVSGNVSVGASNPSYTVRILVRYPQVLQKFSGIVLAECMHSNGTSVEFSPMRLSIMVRGHVAVEIAAQASNVNTLKTFNPDRYQNITIPAGSSVTSQIIGQVATLIKSDPAAVSVPSFFRHLILMGSSNTSQVLRTYQSQIHVQYRMPDGSAIFDGYFATSTLGNSQMMVVDVPTIQMPTQTEVTNQAAATGGIQYRRPDSDDPGNRFRIYEVAGLSHINTRDSVQFEPNRCSLPMVTDHEFPWGAMAAVGLNHLVEWVDKGTVPPRAPYISTYLGADGKQHVELDIYGNAVGGVRNTYVDVPIYQYGVPNWAPPEPTPPTCSSPSPCFLCSLASWQVPLPDDTLKSLYKNRGQYISQVEHSLMDFIRDGWYLPEYADVVRTDAQAFKMLIKP